MLVISPWSRGGWVCSETFDHTSTLRFMEARFGVAEPNISAWRRRTAGDLTSALRFPQPVVPFPTLPDPAANLLLEQQEVATFPAPTVPTVQSLPQQEPGGARLVNLTVNVNRTVLPLGQQATVTAMLGNAAGKNGNQGGSGGPGSNVLRIRPATPLALTRVSVALNAPAGWGVQATSPTTFASLDPGQAVGVTWVLTAPSRASSAASLMPTVAATYQVGQDQTGIEDPVVVTVPIPLTAAFNNAGISGDGNQPAADFDGGGFSYSQQGLTAAGAAPGAAVTSGGIHFLMPNVAAGQPDNVIASHQAILVPALSGAAAIGFLGSAGNGDASGQVTISFTDGSSQTATLGFSDWTLGGGGGTPQFGNGIAAVTPYRNDPNGAPETVKTYLFSSAPIAIPAGKTVATVGMPAMVSGGQIHVFAIGTDKGPLSPA
jgi:hypothetical protein